MLTRDGERVLEILLLAGALGLAVAGSGPPGADQGTDHGAADRVAAAERAGSDDARPVAAAADNAEWGRAVSLSGWNDRIDRTVRALGDHLDRQPGSRC